MQCHLSAPHLCTFTLPVLCLLPGKLLGTIPPLESLRNHLLITSVVPKQGQLGPPPPWDGVMFGDILGCHPGGGRGQGCC